MPQFRELLGENSTSNLGATIAQLIFRSNAGAPTAEFEGGRLAGREFRWGMGLMVACGARGQQTCPTGTGEV